MNPILRNIMAVVIGLILGSVVNMLLISVSGKVIPPPNGIDVTTEAGLKAAMHLFEPKHFLFPFLAHGLGTLVGAFFAALIAATRKMLFAMVIGLFFLFGGVATIFMLPSPLWYSVVDIVFAYLPMAWIGAKLARA